MKVVTFGYIHKSVDIGDLIKQALNTGTFIFDYPVYAVNNGQDMKRIRITVDEVR